MLKFKCLHSLPFPTHSLTHTHKHTPYERPRGHFVSSLLHLRMKSENFETLKILHYKGMTFLPDSNSILIILQSDEYAQLGIVA